MNTRALVAILFGLISIQAIAADIAREVVTSTDRSDAYAELRLSLITAKLPLIGFNDQDSVAESDDSIHLLGLGLDARLRYRRLFLELVESSFSNITLGYILADSDSHSVELIGTNVFSDVERNDVAGLESIADRDADFNLGIRTSHYRGKYTFQGELMGDSSGAHNGVMGALHVGRQAQLRNWNLHGLLGVRSFSDRVVDYYFGVPADEASVDTAEYEAKAGVLPSVQIGATLPLSEKWLFIAQAEYLHLPDSVVDSPLAQGEAAYLGQVGVSYIFGGR